MTNWVGSNDWHQSTTVPLPPRRHSGAGLGGDRAGLLLSPVLAQGGSAPAKPRGLSATASRHQVVLTWKDPGDHSITGYVILRREKDTQAQGAFATVAPTPTQRRPPTPTPARSRGCCCEPRQFC